jgi:hypothetical protein
MLCASRAMATSSSRCPEQKEVIDGVDLHSHQALREGAAGRAPGAGHVYIARGIGSVEAGLLAGSPPIRPGDLAQRMMNVPFVSCP